METEYRIKCTETYYRGGVLWLIERKDTNEFLFRHFQLQRTDRPYQKWEAWKKDIDVLTIFFLTKEDAEKELPFLNLLEGGCYCCGHGSKNVVVEITEHEFVGSKEKI